MDKSVFETLNAIDVSSKIEKKNGLSYLSWAWAWAEVKKIYPKATYTIYERDTQFGPVNYFTDGKTCWVKTGITIEGLEHIEDLPVMDFRNKSISLDKVTSFDVNKAIQRSLTKALARHGLGLYIYAGEDLPEELVEEKKKTYKKVDGNRNNVEPNLETIDMKKAYVAQKYKEYELLGRTISQLYSGKKLSEFTESELDGIIEVIKTEFLNA